MTDVLSASEYFAKQEFVDPNRLAIVGHSRGGMVTLLAIEKAPKRFKAAVDVAGIADFIAFMGYKDEWRREEVASEAHFKGKLPSENLPAYLEISPMTHVDDIQTPLFIAGTTSDKTVPFSLHSGRLIDALKARGRPPEVKLYDNAPGGHIFLFGDSDERRDLFQRIFSFLDRHLKP